MTRRSLRVRSMMAAAACASGLAADPARAQATQQEAMIEELLRQLRLRDSVIEDLQRRVGALESEVGVRPQARRVPVAPAAAPSGSVAPPAAVPNPAAPPVAPRQAQATPAVGEPSDAVAPPAPGTVEIDEEAAERALERTLTEAGALLLPLGRAEISPSFAYTRRENQIIDNTVLSTGGDLFTVATETTVDRNEIQSGVDIRIGLPWDTQLELNLPFSFVDQKVVASDVSLSGGRLQFDRATDSNSGIGFGDVSVGIAKTVLRERGWIPDTVVRVTYDSATGRKTQNGVGLPGTPGFHDIRTSLSIVKRQDPLAFVGAFSYQHTFSDERGGVDLRPGDQYSFLLGAILAASPATSIQFNFQQTFEESSRRDGITIDDSNTSSAILSIGASTILARNVLLTASAGVGLGRDAPEYVFRLAVPVRFDTPFF